MKHIGIALLSFGTFVAPILAFAAIPTFYPFGGHITYMHPCNTGVLLLVGPPNPAFLMLMPYSLYFPTYFFIPNIPTLGIASFTPVPCVTGVVPTGAGLPITIGGTAGQ